MLGRAAAGMGGSSVYNRVNKAVYPLTVDRHGSLGTTEGGIALRV